MRQDQAHDFPAQDATRAQGLAVGSTVLTLEGALPIEFLSPGDRIVTRRGARVLRAVSVVRVSGLMFRIRRGTLGFDRPDSDALVAAATGVLLRDWRAKALYGSASAIVPVARLADGVHVIATEVRQMHVHALHFDAEEVIHADGMEIACTPALVAG